MNPVTKSKKACVVGIGELVWDQLPDVSIPGGAPANFAFHAMQLGADAVVVSAVGNDPAGDRIGSWLGEKGLNLAYIQRNDFPTGVVGVRVNEEGQPLYNIAADAAWDHLFWNDDLIELASRADCVCVGSLAQRSAVSRSTIQRFLANVRPKCLRIFDVNFRDPYCYPTIMLETLRQANVVKMNFEEWLVISRMLGVDPSLENGLPQLLRLMGWRLMAVTRAAMGSVLANRDGIHHIAAREVRIADTIGAGDAFTAALAVGVLCNRPLHEIHARAAEVAAFVCTRAGAMPRLPAELIDHPPQSTPWGCVLKPNPVSVSLYPGNSSASLTENIDTPRITDANSA